MRVRALIVVLLLSIAGCSGVGVVPGGTSESLLGTASTATDTADATSSARPDSTPTTVVQHYPVSRNPRHTLLVLGGEPGGAYPGPAIYTWDVELRRSAPIYDLPEGAHILSAALSSPDASRVVLYGYDADGDQTERLLRAIATPGVHVLAHPRGRHFHQRPGLRARWELVFSACAERGVAVEINGFPRRQDLDWELARLAVEAGCDFLLASDAHAASHLEFDAYACAIAIKAGVPRERVLNAGQLDAFAAWIADR